MIAAGMRRQRAEGGGGAEMITMGSDISAVARDVGLTPYMARFASESMNT